MYNVEHMKKFQYRLEREMEQIQRVHSDLKKIVNEVEQLSMLRNVEVTDININIDAILRQGRSYLRMISNELDSLIEDHKEYVSPNKELIDQEMKAMNKSNER